MKVFITGATGFLGYHITIACVNAGHDVMCLHRKNSKNPFTKDLYNKIQWVEISDLERILSFSPEVLIHSAWSGLNHTDRNIADIQNENIKLQKDILDLFPYKQVIVLGSMEEYGYPGVLMTEELPMKPFSAYTYAKVACLENLLEYASKRNIEWQWIRVCTIYGENQQSAWLIPTLISNCLKQKPFIETTKGEQQYGFLFATDFGNGIASIVGQKGKSGIYNISSHESVFLYEVFDLIKDLTNYKGIFTKSLAYRGNGNLMILADSSKFKKTFGDFETVALREGLQYLINKQK